MELLFQVFLKIRSPKTWSGWPNDITISEDNATIELSLQECIVLLAFGKWSHPVGQLCFGTETSCSPWCRHPKCRQEDGGSAAYVGGFVPYENEN